MRIRTYASLLAVASVFAFVRAAHADELTEEEAAVQLHGFVSQGALWSTDNNFLANTERGSLEFTEAAIAVTKQIDPNLRVGFQLFARDLGPVGNYNAKFDWFSIDYRWRDWLGVRVGRNKLPYGLYNDTSDIDAAHTVILLPQSVYSISSRDFLLAETGVELYGYKRLGNLGALDYRAYGGTIYLTLQGSPGVSVDAVDVPWIAGGRVMWETPLAGLRVGASFLAGEIDADLTQSMIHLDYELHDKQWITSVEYSVEPFLFAAEVGRGYSETKVLQFPPGMNDAKVTGEYGYAMAAYRALPWLQPTLYYAISYPDVTKHTGRESHRYDGAAAVRFDITPSWILKLEAHAMRGTAGLDPALNDGVQPAGLANKWYLLAAKTTVYF
ncbi:MAG TPA: hypothetical protein VGM39_19745 [Kofleriaceae bacterium]|jgi:hypothetical protein